MFRRDELGLPSFWVLQIAGWSLLSTFVMLCLVPYWKDPGTIRGNAASLLAMFALSFALRPLCRSSITRTTSWLALETKAFLWCVPAGVLTTAFSALCILPVHLLNWGEWLTSIVQAVVVLFLWCSLYFSIKQWQQSARERDRLLRAEAEVREARLNALRYQLNPHFLFNSLNAVSTLILEGNATAATRMLAQIGDLLRSTLDDDAQAQIPLAQEIAFIERYLAIEQTRLGPRLHLEMGIDPETFDALVPAMLLQPLVENAVRHGIASQLAGGTIRIRSARAADRLQIVIRNSGASVSAQTERLPASGIGLRNTAERLRTQYGDDHARGSSSTIKARTTQPRRGAGPARKPGMAVRS